jgi:ABC-type transporter Mla maintaining outer membrane lipid asymmetry permease subunit MlaE
VVRNHASAPRSLEGRLAHLRAVGVNALPIVALISFCSAILAFLASAVPMRQFGAEILSDLVDLHTARARAADDCDPARRRSGAAFAAEIGTMKVNDELNALTTMGLDPVRFPVVAHHAALLMMPLLVIFRSDRHPGRCLDHDQLQYSDQRFPA